MPDPGMMSNAEVEVMMEMSTSDVVVVVRCMLTVLNVAVRYWFAKKMTFLGLRFGKSSEE